MVLRCIALVLQLCCLYDASVCCLPFHIISTEHSIITQGVSFVLFWQPSDCIDLSVIDHIFVFSENKYDDDE